MPPSVMKALETTTNLTVALITQAFDSVPHGKRNCETRQWNKDRLFCSMQEGDIVCLMIPNKKFHHEVCCGVIESDEINVNKTQDLAGDMGLVDYQDIPYLARRKVKWLRRAKMRDLPGQSSTTLGWQHVPWLVETSPLFLLDVTEKARVHLASEEFLDCSSMHCSDETV